MHIKNDEFHQTTSPIEPTETLGQSETRVSNEVWEAGKEGPAELGQAMDNESDAFKLAERDPAYTDEVFQAASQGVLDSTPGTWDDASVVTAAQVVENANKESFLAMAAAIDADEDDDDDEYDGSDDV